MSEESPFKHDANRVIESCAKTLEEEMGFNSLQVLRHFHLFTMHFFENTPQVPFEEIDDWYYFRDSWTHSAVIFNYETKELRLVEPEHYWDDDTLEFFRKSEEELEAEWKQHDKEMDKIKRTLAYRELNPVIKWYFTCPLPFITVYGETSAYNFIKNVLEKYPENFELESDDYEELTNNLFDAYSHDKRVREREQNFIVVSTHEFINNEEFIGAESFQTPQDVLEFLIKHEGKEIITEYNENLKSYIITLK